jgi:hypothetical protein
MPQQTHVIDAVRAGDHARHQPRDLRTGIRALVGRHTQMHLRQLRQPADRANASTGTSPTADTRFGSSNTADTADDMSDSCLREMPFLRGELEP